MKNRKKFCFSCKSEKFIWGNRDGKKYCMDCWRKLLAPEKKDPTLARPLIPKKINPVSPSKRQALERYKRLRAKYFEEHPVCEFPNCNSREITLHHKKGRVGAFLTDKRFFCSLCQEHHTWVETHPTAAKKMGLSLSRLEK